MEELKPGHTQLFVNRNPAMAGFEIWVVHREYSGDLSVMAPGAFHPEKEGDQVEPTLRLRKDEMQGLMDELWNQGVRPTRNESAGAFEAQNKHLEDMRKIAFMFLERPKE
jgi:hypothetical protein